MNDAVVKKSQKGFTTIWLVLILFTLMMLLLVITEAAAGYAAGSIAEDLCAVSGESLLSEFNKALFDRYGVFALRANSTRLTSAASYYISGGLEEEGCLVKMKLTDCSVCCEEFPALDPKLFSAQIRPLGTAAGVYSIVTQNSLQGLISGLLEASESAGTLSGDVLSELQGISSKSSDYALPDDADEITEEMLEQAEENALASENSGLLIEELEDASSPGFEIEEGGTISSALASELPSAVMGIKPTLSLLLSGGVSGISANTFAEDEYILSVCGNHCSHLEKTVLDGEVEYILYGRSSDEANMKALKLSLFEMRSALDLSFILADSAKMAEINAAAAAFLPVPVPVTALAMASIEACRNAADEVRRLCSGGRVPFAPGGSGGEYADYLRVLLALLSQDVRMTRLMDIMQMDLTEEEGAAFAFQDFCYGVRIDAQFEKQTHLLGIDGISKRSGWISETYCYE